MQRRRPDQKHPRAPLRDEPLFPNVDVRVRLLTAVAALVVTVAARGPVLPTAMLLLSIGIGVFLRVRARVIAARLVAPCAMAVAAFAGQLFTGKGTPLFAFSLGPWLLTATDAGLEQGLLLALRILGIISIVLTLSFSTPFPQLLHAARWFRVPSTLVELASLMYRYLFLLRDEALTMAQAQRARLGYTGYRRSLRSAASLGGTALTRAFTRANAIHLAMCCRGYQGDLRGETLPPLGWRAAAQLALAVVLLAAVFYLDGGLPLGWYPIRSGR